MKPFTSLTSRTIVLPQTDIDTDQIIPARFLTTTTREGLGAHAFHDWRNDDGETAHLLNRVDTDSHRILVAGANFGCGSSREHAPWALLDFGFRVVVSRDIADIFTSNALKNGLLPVEVPADMHAVLMDRPDLEITVDLEQQCVSAPGIDCSFAIEPFARRCLLDGVDPLGALLARKDDIAAYEARRPAL